MSVREDARAFWQDIKGEVGWMIGFAACAAVGWLIFDPRAKQTRGDVLIVAMLVIEALVEAPWQLWALVAGLVAYGCHWRNKRRQKVIIDLLWKINQKLGK